MNLAEVREKVANKKLDLKIKEKQLAAKQKDAEEIKSKTKEATLSDDELTNLKEKAQAVADVVSDLTTEIADLGTEIEEAEAEVTEAEAQLEETSKKLKEKKGKKTMTENYMKTKEAAIAFAKLLMDNEGKSSKSIRKDWEDHLATKGVTGLENILPEPVMIALHDAFKDYDGVLNHVSRDPRYAAKITFQTIQNFGLGHKAGVVKKDANVNFTSFTINSATVYIKFMFEYADLKKDTSGTYFNYVMGELAKGFIRAVERAMIIGDGLAANHEDKITEIKSIAEETEATLFATQEIDLSEATFDQAVLEALVSGVDQMAQNGNPILVTSKAVARKLKMVRDVEGRYIDPQPFAPIATTGNTISGYRVYVYDWMDTATNPIIAFADRAYTMIGDDPMDDRFDEYDITVNRRHVELVSVMGGRLSEFKSAVKFEQATP